eukprot:TRINITY_DN19920_c1_g3_i4.p1 TRINITY_DN19920_c1_g3~~TRINITY_DN19920_c1_g3_i4.p1  ORF type:complete len:1554 (+),score=423.63 TRINITY_DN19920_c1_g3_i4:84-4664(+)
MPRNPGAGAAASGGGGSRAGDAPRRGSRPSSASPPGARRQSATTAWTGAPGSASPRTRLAPIASPRGAPPPAAPDAGDPFAPAPLVRSRVAQQTEDLKYESSILCSRVDAICDDEEQHGGVEDSRDTSAERRRTLAALSAADDRRATLLAELSPGPTAAAPTEPAAEVVAPAAAERQQSQPVGARRVSAQLPSPQRAEAGLTMSRRTSVLSPEAEERRARLLEEHRKEYRSLADSAGAEAGSRLRGRAEEEEEEDPEEEVNCQPSPEELRLVSISPRPLHKQRQMLEVAKEALASMPLPRLPRDAHARELMQQRGGCLHARRAQVLRLLTLGLAATQRAAALSDGAEAELAQAVEREQLAKRKHDGKIADLNRELSMLRTQVAELREELQESRRRLRASIVQRPNSPSPRSPASAAASPRGPSAQPGGGHSGPRASIRDVLCPQGDVTVAYTDVQSSTWLWDHNAEAMKSALFLHTDELRKLLIRHSGYEVKAEGDAFKVVFQDARSAVEWALESQIALMRLRWPAELLAATADDTDSGEELFRGLRVRCGLHRGSPLTALDQVSDRMDFFGPPVNVAQRVCGLCCGGEVLATEAVWEGVRSAPLRCVDTPLGQVRLRGVSQPVALHRILPEALAGRGAVFDRAKHAQAAGEDPASGPMLTPRPRARSTCSQASGASATTEPADGRRRSQGAIGWIAQKQLAARRQLNTIAAARRRAEEGIRKAAAAAAEPPQGPVAIVFTDIQGAPQLWDANPEATLEAIRVHDEVLRAHFKTHQCFEARTDGGCFMAVCGSVSDALRLCADVQLALLRADWPPALGAQAPAEEVAQGEGLPSLFRGLRLRMAVHHGEPLLQQNPVTKRGEYSGPEVSTAAAACAIAFGGEILITGAAADVLRRSGGVGALGLVSDELPPRVLPGAKEPVALWRVLPAELEQRRLHFPEAQRDDLPAPSPASRLCAPFARRTLQLHWTESEQSVQRALKSIEETERMIFAAPDAPGLADLAPPTGRVTIVFTDVQGSTQLWDREPMAMRAALVLHNNAMRGAMPKHNGYEVKTEGDAFMVTFAKPSGALAWCAEMQRTLVTLDWPEEILSSLAAAVERVQQTVVWRGLRVRMGFHTGEPFCDPDPITGRMDYFGPMVNEAARLSGQARGGEIVAGAVAANEALAELGAANYVVTDLGEIELRGIRAPVPMMRVMPRELSLRHFGPLKVAKAAQVEKWWAAADAQKKAQAQQQSAGTHRTVSRGPVLDAVSLAISTAVTEMQLSAKEADRRRKAVSERVAGLIKALDTDPAQRRQFENEEIAALDAVVQSGKRVLQQVKKALSADQVTALESGRNFLTLDHAKLLSLCEEVSVLSDEADERRCKQAAVLSRFKLAALNTVRRRCEDPAVLLQEQRRECEAMRTEFQRVHRMVLLVLAALLWDGETVSRARRPPHEQGAGHRRPVCLPVGEVPARRAAGGGRFRRPAGRAAQEPRQEPHSGVRRAVRVRVRRQPAGLARCREVHRGTAQQTLHRPQADGAPHEGPAQ